MTTDTEPTVLVQVPAWLARTHSLVSRELAGHITRQTDRAVHFVGHASMRQATHCLRCGRELTEGVSQTVGYGPDCSDYLGIPRDPDPEAIDAYRQSITRDTHVELWLPKSQITTFDTNGAVAEFAPPEPQTEPLTTITVNGDTLEVASHYQHKDRCKQVAGARWNPNKKRWTYQATPAVAAGLVDAFEGLPLEHDDAFAVLLDQVRVMKDAAQHKDRDDLPDIPGTDPDKPAWMHQRQAFWFAKPLTAAGLWMDMGTGKSRVTTELMRTNDARRVVIVCPNNVQNVWRRELAKWWPDSKAEIFIFRDHKGTLGARAEAAAVKLQLAQARNVPFILVLNYEAVWRDAVSAWLLKLPWDYVIADESHRIKSPGSKVSKFMARLGKKATHRLALSGTPMANSPLDVYGQYRFLDPGIFGTNFARFRARYAMMGGYGGYQVLGYQNEDELHEKVYSIGYHVTAEDALDLPDVKDIPRTVELSKKARKLYDDVNERFYATTEEGNSFTAANVLTRILRSQQITGGAINDDDGDNIEIDHAKEEALEELLADMAPDEPVVVFTRFVHDLRVVERVAAKLGKPYGELSGRRGDAVNDNSLMRDEVVVAGVQIQSGGVGIDLTRARYAIYYSLGHSLTDYLQSRKRVHRPGQERHVTLYHLIAEDTVDEDVYEALEAKEEVVDHIMRLDKKRGRIPDDVAPEPDQLDQALTVLADADGDPDALEAMRNF